MSQTKDPGRLSGLFPWLSDELAEVITRRLTSYQLMQLSRELKTALGVAEVRLIEYLLVMRPAERNAYMAERVNQKTEGEDT